MGDDTQRTTDEPTDENDGTEPEDPTPEDILETDPGHETVAETGDREETSTETETETGPTIPTTTDSTDTRTTPEPDTTSDTDDETGEQPLATTVIVDGEPITIDPDTTANELKAMTSADSDDVLTFRPADVDQVQQIPDDEPVLEYVEPGTQLTFQPATGNLFG